jgi:hypothetical protein
LAIQNTKEKNYIPENEFFLSKKNEPMMYLKMGEHLGNLGQ